ncbi:uncharacterized protein BT62DRAFT_1013353 [Guyanagaster necrorhizus]|uniref:Uncharacterized protein n=1 Tax=Guyanagaster necrorhizus TaxID=856835 RepID=A0A9P7VGY9_9AGAR|nr:uncharacterized protein BT62DRAFT_1013353 [Guyanagaster necrorhizus MCA 3950]KAG7439901.1 hypothetical protein BT62DRAFT_1013353 [Guyanagaster necrorhizus MCA 3950]
MPDRTGSSLVQPDHRNSYRTLLDPPSPSVVCSTAKKSDNMMPCTREPETILKPPICASVVVRCVEKNLRVASSEIFLSGIDNLVSNCPSRLVLAGISDMPNTSPDIASYDGQREKMLLAGDMNGPEKQYHGTINKEALIMILRIESCHDDVRSSNSSGVQQYLNDIFRLSSYNHSAFTVALSCNAITCCLLFVSCETKNPWPAILLKLPSSPSPLYHTAAITVVHRFFVKSLNSRGRNNIPRIYSLRSVERLCNDSSLFDIRTSRLGYHGESDENMVGARSHRRLESAAWPPDSDP